MSREESNKLKYTIALIAEFADKFSIGKRQAYNYLKRFKGLEFLNTHYGVEHTQSFENTVEDLSIVCNRNGGKLKYTLS